MPALYDRALPEQPASVWDFSAWQPDAVVINLGTNDFSTEGDPSEAVFSAAYRAFLLHVREISEGVANMSRAHVARW